MRRERHSSDRGTSGTQIADIGHGGPVRGHHRDVTSLFGEALSPLGHTVAFIEAPHALVLQHLFATRQREGDQTDVLTDLPMFPGCLTTLLPPHSPRTAELLVLHGITWTAYLSNDPDDQSVWSTCQRLATDLGVAGVTASHVPGGQDGTELTSLQITHWQDERSSGPTQRTISTHCHRGRWSWDSSGEPLPFEDPEAYRTRKVRDRFTRELLLQYLAAVHIFVDDPSFYGVSTLLRHATHPVTTPRR